jgi:hypothetical protein
MCVTHARSLTYENSVNFLKKMSTCFNKVEIATVQ